MSSGSSRFCRESFLGGNQCVVGGSDAGWVALERSIWRGVGYPEPLDLPDPPDVTFARDVRVRPSTSATFRCGSLHVAVATGGVEVVLADGVWAEAVAGSSAVFRESADGVSLEVVTGTATVTGAGVVRVTRRRSARCLSRCGGMRRWN